MQNSISHETTVRNTDVIVRTEPSGDASVYGQHFQQSMDQPGMVAISARGQLNREKKKKLSSFAPENLVSS